MDILALLGVRPLRPITGRSCKKQPDGSSAEGDAGLDAPHRLMYIQDRALDILCSDRTLPFFSGVCPTRIDLSIFESTPINWWTEKSPRNGGP
jgi:hypothetical protein